MTNFLIIIMAAYLILDPGKAFTQETAAQENNFVLSEADINAVNNPFLDPLPAPEIPPDSVQLPTTTPIKTTAPITTSAQTSAAGNISSPSQPAPMENPAPTKSLKPAKPAEIKLPSFTINGLVWNTDLPQAIINSKILGIGDSIEDSVITNIDQTGVEVLKEGKKFKIFYK